ncbi:MAG: phosphoribosylglycinamide formyltransferase [Anaerolineae bacterium]|jgi:formyltetrahydrofolate-dependent phosphoribosylglycinamide formyltransferase|nr:phosphoribosylglycinamide formyltransferase [Anaerolineae bacterium]
MSTERRVVVMVSGSGTNLQALIDAIGAGHLPCRIVLVVSNRREAFGLTRAETHGIPTAYVPLKPYTAAGKTREEYDRDLADVVAEAQPDLIVLAGWMHVLGEGFLARFPHRVINLHPALPGAFAGTRAIERTFAAWQAGEVEVGGCMVHYVVPEVDAGAPLVVAHVPILERDSLADFEMRLHATEHQIIVQAVRLALSRVV